MNSLTIVCLLVLLPACASISCYICAGGSGCDPFSATGSGVTTGSGYSSCQKTTANGAATSRTGSSSCVAANFGGYGTWCCTTDYCNGATSKYQATFLMGVLLAALFAKNLLL